MTATKRSASTRKQVVKDNSAKAEVIEITPELAEEWLVKNTHNRNVIQWEVDRLSEAMKAGDWRMNGEAIKWGKNDVILDGQHRLWAVLESGATIQSLVVWELEPETQDTMDGGRKRTLGDVLSIRGEVNTAVLATIISHVYVWQHHGPERMRHLSRFRPITKEALAFLEDHPEMREVTREAGRYHKRLKTLLPISTIGTLLWVFAEIDREDCEVFFDTLSDPSAISELAADDARLVLRKFIVDHQSKAYRYPPWHMMAVTIKAWNAWREGKAVARLFFIPGGSKAEKFPVPK